MEAGPEDEFRSFVKEQSSLFLFALVIIIIIFYIIIISAKDLDSLDFFMFFYSFLAGLPSRISDLFHIRIVSFNGWHFNKKNDNRRDLVEDFLRRYRPDIFLLQEYKFAKPFTEFFGRNFAGLPNSSISPKYKKNNEGYVNFWGQRCKAIYSNSANLNKNGLEKIERPPLVDELEVDGYAKIRVGNFHVPFKKELIQQNLQELPQLNDLRKREDNIVVLGGDFNLGLLKNPPTKIGHLTKTMSVPTTPANQPHDNFFISDEQYVVEAIPLKADDWRISDHFMILLVLNVWGKYFERNLQQLGDFDFLFKMLAHCH